MSSVSSIPQSTTVPSIANLIISTNIARLSPVMTSVTKTLQGVALPMELDMAPQGIGMPQVFVKPQHLTYLRDFRTQQCPLFANHKCSQHKPFTCFHWHFPNQRRRRPLRKLDGTFAYSPDVYCDKYDETRGECPNGDACPYLHRNAGDTERRYHLRYFKTGTCIHDTDARGQCSRNGVHCAFAHGASDLRVPVYDIREVQEASDCPVNLPASLEKERVLSEDPKWNDMGYVLASYKTEPCRKPPRMCRQGYACPFYHNSKDKRRPPQLVKYRSTPCPTVKASDEWQDSSLCEAGDDCQFCHTRTEQQFHPEIYKSTKCNDVMHQHYCPRGPFCAFAHDEGEMNFGRNFMQEAELQGLLISAAAVLGSGHDERHQSSSPATTSAGAYGGALTLAQLMSPSLWDPSLLASAIKGRTASGLSSASLESGLGSWSHVEQPSSSAAAVAEEEDASTAAAAAAAAAAATAALLPDFDEFDELSSQDSNGCGYRHTGCSPLTVQTAMYGGGGVGSISSSNTASSSQDSPAGAAMGAAGAGGGAAGALQTVFEVEPESSITAPAHCGSSMPRSSGSRRRPPSESSGGGGGGGGGYAQSPILMSESPFSNAGLELERLRYECEIERAQAEARRAREAAQRALRERAAAEEELRRLCARVGEAARLADGLSAGGGGGEFEAFWENLKSLLELEPITEQQQQQPPPPQVQPPAVEPSTTKFSFARAEESEPERVQEKR